MTQGDENAELADLLRQQEKRRDDRRQTVQRTVIALAVLAALVVAAVAWTLIQGDLAGQG